MVRKAKRESNGPQGDTESPVLDLGLSKIIEGFEEANRKDALKEKNAAEDESSGNSTHGNGNSEVELNEYEALSNLNRWDRLYRLCEARTGSTSDKDSLEYLEAKVWWVRSQLELGNVPVSMLSAPLDSVSREISSRLNRDVKDGIQNPETAVILKACADVLISLASGLSKSYEMETSITFLERAGKLNPAASSAINKAAKNKLDSFKQRLAAIKFRTDEQKKSDSKLIQRIEKLISLSSTPVGTVELKASQNGTPKGQKKIKDLVEEIQDKRKMAKGTNSALAADQSSSESNESSLGAEIEDTTPPRRQKRFVLGTVFLSILLSGSVYLFQAFNSGQTGGILAGRDVYLDEDLLRTGSRTSLPEVRRISDLSGLDALYYGMSRRLSKARLKKSETLQKSGTAPQKSSGKTGTHGKKEAVNTDTPLEGTQFHYGSRRSVSRSPDSRPLDAPTGSRTTPGLTPDSAIPVPASPVERFETPRRYRVISPSKVMSRPSYWAEELDSVPRGAEVNVTHKIGPWLKIRSKLGKSGFILAQDVVEIRR